MSSDRKSLVDNDVAICPEDPKSAHQSMVQQARGCGGSPSPCRMPAIHQVIVPETNSTVRVLLHPLRRLPGKESEEPEQQKRGQPSGHVIR